jgi:hypothetical protein
MATQVQSSVPQNPTTQHPAIQQSHIVSLSYLYAIFIRTLVMQRIFKIQYGVVFHYM